jgi:uncharacterized caspase-like protein
VPLLDTEATRQNILTALSNIAGAPQAGASSLPKLNELHALQPEDVAVVYYAGHGAAIGDRFYLLPHDFSAAGADAAHAIAATSVSDADLENLFVEGTSTGRVVLILDACNSGQALNADDPRRGPMNSRGLGQLAYDKGMYVLAAAQGFQAALETQRLGHGNLTFALLEGLKEVAKSAGKVTFDDTIPAKLVLEYAARRVPELQREDARSKRAALLAAAGTADAVQQPRLFIRDELERQQPLVIGMDQTDLAPGGLILPPLVK